MSNPSYVIPFNALLKQAGLADKSSDEPLQLTRDELLTLVRKLLVSVHVDETWYKGTYPDVETAIASGAFRSAKEHFVANGYFEGRLPAKITVDADFYTTKYPDIAEGIEDGDINSAQEHFEANGYLEGRQPFEL